MSGQFDRTEVRWGATDRLSAREAVMWRAEADPVLRSAGVIVELLDATPDWTRLVAGVQWGLARIPRLRERVLDDPLRVGSPRWVPADIDLSYHMRRTRLHAGATFDNALDVAATLHMEPFDRSRPLWRLELVQGLPDGRSALLLKLHHTLADGPAIVQLFDLLHSDRREPTPDKPLPPPDGGARPLGRVGVVRRNSLRLVRGGPRAAARAAAAPASVALGALRTPGPTASSSLAYARSLRRVTLASPGAASPLLRERSLSRRLAVLEVPRRDLREGARAAGGTLNDGFLTALTGGLARYHALHGTAVGDLGIALPVSLRTAQDAPGGNRFADARIGAPAGVADPTTRLQLLRGRVLAARHEPALDVLGTAAPAISRAPTPLLTRMTAGIAAAADVHASTFRGLARDAYVAGCRIDRMYVFGPVPGCAMNVLLVTHQDTCCVAVAVDAASVPDLDVLVGCLREGVDEVVALGRSAVL